MPAQSSVPSLVKIVLGAALLAALAFGAYRLSERLRRPPEVKVAEVREEPVTRVLAVTGRVRPRARNRLTPLSVARPTQDRRSEGWIPVSFPNTIGAFDPSPPLLSVAQHSRAAKGGSHEVLRRYR